LEISCVAGWLKFAAPKPSSELFSSVPLLSLPDESRQAKSETGLAAGDNCHLLGNRCAADHRRPVSVPGRFGHARVSLGIPLFSILAVAGPIWLIFYMVKKSNQKNHPPG